MIVWGGKGLKISAEGSLQIK